MADVHDYSETIPGVADRLERQHRRDVRFVFGGSLFRIIIAILLFVTVLRFLMGASTVTFTGFLEMLRDTPLISTDWLQNWSTNVAGSLPNWLSWLGSFIDWFVSAFQMMMFLSVSIVNIFPFVAHFLWWFFTA